MAKQELDVITTAKEASDVQNPADTKRISVWVNFLTGFLRRKNNTGVIDNLGVVAAEATLVAGTIAVADANVTATTMIALSRRVLGAAPGNLSYTLNPGVGFTINSDNVADVGTISYQIVSYF